MSKEVGARGRFDIFLDSVPSTAVEILFLSLCQAFSFSRNILKIYYSCASFMQHKQLNLAHYKNLSLEFN